MNINILLSVENEIVKSGLTSIISNGVLGSNIIAVDKSIIIEKVEANFFDIAIIDMTSNGKVNHKIINKIISLKNKTRIFFFSNNKLHYKTEAFLKSKDIDFIFSDSSSTTIINQIKFNIEYSKNKNLFIRRKNNKLKSIDNLLSKREFEIGTMLIKGYSLRSIAQKNNIAASTVSTYKRRIFEKIKVKNVIEMSKLFN